MVEFSSKAGKPFPRNVGEWMDKGYSQEQAEHKVAQDVFGNDYQKDKAGNPIERGKGSASQPTAQHQQALAIAQDAEMARKMRMGWHPGLEQAFNPREPRRKKQVRRKTAAGPAEGTA
jgi:hypothetical protein